MPAGRDRQDDDLQILIFHSKTIRSTHKPHPDLLNFGCENQKDQSQE